MAQQKSSSDLPEPLRTMVSALRRVPGAETVGRATEGALNAVGAVSPRGRRLAVYTGAGVLGAVGLVEWPVAVTGAAVAWLTQSRPEQSERSAQADGSRSAQRTASGARKTASARSTASGRSAAKSAARSATRNAAKAAKAAKSADSASTTRHRRTAVAT
ncbi:hypothetical protein AB0L85_13815 [Streptomyces sp. NPDC052051]|uniref:hypothetical protein n=1 Tax=Streptomyces sp. NPDC052051 TaxID=3154649 RepID=UPI00342CB715